MPIHQLSRRARAFKSSDVRDLLKYARQPGMISLAGGLPAAELLDVEGIRAAATEALAQSPVDALQYGATDGQASFRRALVRHLNARGIHPTPDSLVVTSGSQQALDLMARSLIDEGDVVAVERPTYLAALQAFSLCGPEYVTFASDADGGMVEELENLASAQRPKLVYVVSNFANPSGVTLSAKRREWLVRWATRNQVFVLEDDPYGELRTSGKALPSLVSIAGAIPGAADWVGYTSTLSKCVAPGLRLGWLVLPPELAACVVHLKQAADLHTSSFTQEIAARYLESGRLSDRLTLLRAEYGSRRQMLHAALKSRFGEAIDIAHGEGGMFLWARFTDGTDTRALLPHAVDHGVTFVPGDAFYPQASERNALRLNFTATPLDQLCEGVDRLAAAHLRLHGTAIKASVPAALEN